MINRDIVSIAIAGRVLTKESFTFICIVIAPSMRTESSMRAGTPNGAMSFGTNNKKIIVNAITIFIKPTTYINQEGRPYVANSSFIFLACPPRYLVARLKRTSHTFISPKAINICRIDTVQIKIVSIIIKKAKVINFNYILT